MQADKTILQMKYARIVRLFADKAGLSYEDALGVFYASDVYLMMSQGVADLHCLSDEYLADEVERETLTYRDGEIKARNLACLRRKR